MSQAISNRNEGRKDAGDPEQTIRHWIRGTLDSRPQEHLFEGCMDRFASILISEALLVTGGNRSKAAKLLGVSRPTLHSKIEKYNLRFETSIREGGAS